MRNENKIAFIVCCNKEQFFRECKSYIENLKNARKREIEIIKIENSVSMTSGYNQAMSGSDAKYKVYLHQDVFILNENFIEDFIGVFEKHPEYGMLGVLGCKDKVEGANYWDHWNVGSICAWNSLELIDIRLRNEIELQEVVAIDGLIMITQYDLPWREDLFCGYDMYDISQSAEFYRNGYKVGVPYQKDSWCLHDCGSSNIKNYDVYREIFCREYSDMGYHYKPESKNEQNRLLNNEADKLVPIIWNHLFNMELSEAAYIINSLLKMQIANTQVGMAYIVCKIMLAEQRKNVQELLFKDCKTPDDMPKLLMDYIFCLQRVAYGKEKAGNYAEEKLMKADEEIRNIIAEHAL